MMLKKVKEKVFNNSLETCVYVSGYENHNSVIKIRCLSHDLVFETKYENLRRDNRKHYVCPQCKKEAREQEKNFLTCDFCGAEFLRQASKTQTKSGFHFCCRECKDKAQSISSGTDFKKIRPKHYGTSLKDYRKKALRAFVHECAVCGYNEDVDVLEVHHIDEDRDNNSLENLVILCPLCHKKLTTKKYKLVNNNRSIVKI